MKPGIKRRRSDAAEDEVAITTEERDLAARRDILNSMFELSPSSNNSNNSNSKKKKKSARPPAHTIEAPCSPRNNPDEIVMEDTEIAAQPQRSFERIRARLPPTYEYPAAVTYICRGPTLPGKFKKDAALALGIPPGPIYGKVV